MTGAIGALKGPLHGGANEAVMHTFDEIGIRPDESGGGRARAKAWMEDALAQKKKIMGFGHRVYKHGDSRVPTMKAALDKMIDALRPPRTAGPVRRAGDGDGRGARASSRTSTTRPGPTYHLMGFDTETFTPLFVASAHHRLDRAHHGAARLQLADPPAVRLQRPGGTAPLSP